MEPGSHYLRATKYVLCKKRSAGNCRRQIFHSLLPGSKPVTFVNEEEIAVIKKLFISTIDKLQIDFDKKIFENYTPSPGILKVYGFEVKNIDDALEYLLYHEGLHTGYISSLKHLV